MADDNDKPAQTPTVNAQSKYLYGTDEEVKNRLEHGMAPTESHFNQIRPAGSGPAINEQKGDTKSNRANITHRG